MSQLISVASGYASTQFDTKIPSLADTANIVEAFKLYHYGVDNFDGSGAPAANSIERHFIDLRTLVSSASANAYAAAINVALSYANSASANANAFSQARDDLKADLASPALTGIPTAPTAAERTNTTQVATTAYALAEAASASANANAFSQARDNLKADLASPALTGIPTAPTAAERTNTTQVATTAYALAEAASASANAAAVASTLYLTKTTPIVTAGTTIDLRSASVMLSSASTSGIAALLPSQQFNAGKFLSTDGQDAYWTDVPSAFDALFLLGGM